MSFPPLLTFQKITAEALATFEAAQDNPEGFALLLAEALLTNGIGVVEVEPCTSELEASDDDRP